MKKAVYLDDDTEEETRKKNQKLVCSVFDRKHDILDSPGLYRGFTNGPVRAATVTGILDPSQYLQTSDSYTPIWSKQFLHPTHNFHQ